MQVSELRCRRCHEVKALEEFDRGFFQKQGYDIFCHDGRSEIARKRKSTRAWQQRKKLERMGQSVDSMPSGSA
ncbi:MAG: hypothetical protein MUC80_09905 [Candidatus Thermoplasmatota archaeon]|nr:hypothetical protein [Candidatus Thermoplasmatota archaeon]